jgi:hypothetical protein
MSDSYWEKRAPPPLEPPGYREPAARLLTPASALQPPSPATPTQCCHHDHHCHEREYYPAPISPQHTLIQPPVLGYPYPRTVVASPAGPLFVCPPTDTFCPATGGAHIVRRRQGGVSIFLSVVTFPVGLFTLPFDRKQSCRKCNYVLREAWGGC